VSGSALRRAEEIEQTRPASWRPLVLAWMVYFSFGLGVSSLQILVNPIRADLGLSYAAMGLVLGLWQLVYVGLAIPIGRIIDRFAIRWTIFCGVVTIAASVGTRSAAVGFASIAAAVAIFGIGGPIISVGLPKLISSAYVGRRRGIASGIYATGSQAGNAFGLAITNSLVVPLVGGWRESMLLYACVIAAIAVMWLVGGSRLPRPDETLVGDLEPARRQLWTVVRQRGVWPIFVIGFGSFFGTHGFSSWLPTLLEAKGMSSSASGWLSAISPLAGIVGSIMIVRYAARERRKRATLIVLACFGVGVILVGLASGPLVGVAILAVGLCSSSVLPLMMYTMMQTPAIDGVGLGAAAGVYFAVAEIGGTTGPTAVGGVVDIFGSFFAAPVLLAAIAWLMLLPAWRLAADRPAVRTAAGRTQRN
jgi:cyanate permease